MISIRGDLGWLRQLGSELKGIVSQIFTMSGTTLSAIQRIEQRLLSHSEMALIPTFTLEDAIGRITRVDMVLSAHGTQSMPCLKDALESFLVIRW